jgi:hypothetical protein
MFQLLRRHYRAVAPPITTNAHRPTIVGQPGHRCAVCDTGGPFAWLAYRGQDDARRPVAWLCLYCLELGHAPHAFAARARARHPDARFVVFPGTSLEQERDFPHPAEAAA